MSYKLNAIKPPQIHTYIHTQTTLIICLIQNSHSEQVNIFPSSE